MTDAVGIHAHPTKKLGLRSPVDKPAIRFSDHLLLAAAPPHPTVDAPPQLAWPMDDNDKWGCCVVAGLDHALEAIQTLLTGASVAWTAAQRLAYYRTQNPDFNPTGDANIDGPGSPADGGMVIQLFLEQLVKDGVLLGFAKVNQTNEDEMKAAAYLGLAIVTGETLQAAQQTQSVWDYVPGSPDWGGHCTTTVGYLGAPDNDAGVSWGEEIDQTQAFVQHQVSETWFVLTQAHVDHPGFRQGFNLVSFAAAYQAITGRPFPIAVPPAPAPTPPPTPPSPTPAPPPPTPPGPPPAPPTPPHHHHHRRHWSDWVEDLFESGDDDSPAPIGI